VHGVARIAFAARDKRTRLADVYQQAPLRVLSPRAALATIGLSAQRDKRAGNLSHGKKQWLEIGMLLVQDTQLILLDEPVAGMTDHETEKTAELIRGIVGRHTVVVVEHDMEFVRSLNAKTTVLHEGKVLAEGTIEAVQNNPEVVEMYLGR
jgi:urea transport system ATP-binding protein